MLAGWVNALPESEPVLVAGDLLMTGGKRPARR